MGDFNPSNSLIRVSHETTPGIPRETGWVDHEFVDEDVAPEYGTIQSESITRNSQTPKAQPSKINSGGTINVELDPEGHYHYFANLQKHSATPTNPDTGVYVHKLAPSETDVDFPLSLTVEISRDDDAPSVNKGARVATIDVTVEPESFVRAAIGLVVERSEYYGAAVETSVTSTPTDPIIRGLPNYTDYILADGDVYVQVFDNTLAPDSIEILVKVGAAAAFDDDNPITVPVGVWTELFLTGTSVTRIGTRDIPVQVRWANFTNVTDLDTWRFDRERAVWVPVYADVPKFNEIFAAIYIDDIEYEIDQITLNLTRPAATKHAIGGRHAKRIKERGRRAPGGSFSREYLDVGLKKRLERAQSFGLRLDMYSGEEIEVGYEHSYSFVAMNCVFGTAKHATVQGNEEMNESYPFTCHPSTDVTYPDDITVTITNTIASLAA